MAAQDALYVAAPGKGTVVLQAERPRTCHWQRTFRVALFLALMLEAALLGRQSTKDLGIFFTQTMPLT